MTEKGDPQTAAISSIFSKLSSQLKLVWAHIFWGTALGCSSKKEVMVPWLETFRLKYFRMYIWPKWLYHIIYTATTLVFFRHNIHINDLNKRIWEILRTLKPWDILYINQHFLEDMTKISRHKRGCLSCMCT